MFIDKGNIIQPKAKRQDPNNDEEDEPERIFVTWTCYTSEPLAAKDSNISLVFTSLWQFVLARVLD